MLKGKTCIVTGSSSGIGKGMAIVLARKSANIILLSRHNERGNKAFEEIKKINKKGLVEWIPTDLASQESIRNFVNEFSKTHNKLDYLFNCAGLQSMKRQETADGLEMMFGVNYLGHFLLANLLHKHLKNGIPSLVLTISGRSHKKSRIEGRNEGTINFSDLQGVRNFKFAEASKQAVLAKILFTYEIAKKWKTENIAAVTLCPDLTKTDLVSELPLIVKIMYRLRCIISKAQTPVEAADVIIKLISENNNEMINGKYFEVNRKNHTIIEAQSSNESYNKEISSKLWKISEELVGEKFN